MTWHINLQIVHFEVILLKIHVLHFYYLFAYKSTKFIDQFPEHLVLRY